MSYMSLDGVSKQYGDIWAVDRVDMAVAQSEFISLLGPSGSGKTTLLRIIAGLERPTTGRVMIGGVDVTDQPPHKRGIAMVFQEFLLFPHRTVRENLAFPLRMLKMPREDIAERIKWVVGVLSLTGLEDRYPNQLSGGQQQRVALGRGLVSHPKLLLLDEPLANLDRELRQEMEVEIRRYQMELGIPFIYVTHNQEEALSMSDRIAVVRKGRIEDFSERTSIYDQPKTAFIAQFVGRSNRFEGIIDALSTEGPRTRAHGLILEAAPQPGLTLGAPVLMFVKNEKVRLLKDGATGPNAARCRVKDVILRGAYVEYFLTFEGREIVSSRPRVEPAHRIGDEVTAMWDRIDIDLFTDVQATAA